MTMNLSASVNHPAEALVLARIPAIVRERAAAVRLMVFDVDGVLTDGSLYYGEGGELQKRFHALDGHGLRLLMEGGLKVALITGRSGPIVARRAAELGIADVLQGVRDKGSDVCASDIREFLAAHVAKWWLPDAVEFVDELPHTATGKLSKRTLREQFRDYRFADAVDMVGRD